MTKTSTVIRFVLFVDEHQRGDPGRQGVHADLVGVYVNFGDVHDLGVEAVDRCDPVFELHDFGELFDEPQSVCGSFTCTSGSLSTGNGADSSSAAAVRATKRWRQWR